VFGRNSLASHWSGQQALASYWLEEFAISTLAYLITDQPTLLGIRERQSTFVIAQLYSTSEQIWFAKIGGSK
jgi:hypothetical protein